MFPYLGQLPPTVIGSLHKIFVYHAAYPFPSTSANLSPDALIRAITLLSGKDRYIFSDSSSMRGREILTRGKTERDRRKLLFRSLAVPFEKPDAQDRDSYEIDSRVEALDEVLDVLSVIQPQVSACIAPLARSTLYPTATRLVDTRPRLISLGIRRDDLYNLLLFLLSCQLAGTPNEIFEADDCMARCARVAGWMTQSFVPNGENVVKWDRFDAVIEHTMVCIPP